MSRSHKEQVPAAGSEPATESQTTIGAQSEASGPSGMSARSRLNLVILALVVVAVAGVGFAATATTGPKVAGDTISRTFAQGEPCTTAAIAVSAPEGSDPGKTAEVLFAALSGVAGINTATYNFKTGVLDTGFCDSTVSEDVVRQALATTGLVGAASGDGQ